MLPWVSGGLTDVLAAAARSRAASASKSAMNCERSSAACSSRLSSRFAIWAGAAGVPVSELSSWSRDAFRDSDEESVCLVGPWASAPAVADEDHHHEPMFPLSVDIA